MEGRRRRPRPGERPEPIKTKNKANGDSGNRQRRNPEEEYNKQGSGGGIARQYLSPLIVTAVIAFILRVLGVFRFMVQSLVPVIGIGIVFIVITMVVKKESVSDVGDNIGKTMNKVKGKVDKGMVTKYLNWTRSIYDMIFGSGDDYEQEIEEYNIHASSDITDPFGDNDDDKDFNLDDFDVDQYDNSQDWEEDYTTDISKPKERSKGSVTQDIHGNNLKVEGSTPEVKPVGNMSFQVDKGSALQVHTTYVNDKQSLTKITTDGNREIEVFGSNITVTATNGKVEVYTDTTIDNFDAEPFVITAGQGDNKVNLNLNGVRNLTIESVKVKGQGPVFVLTTPTSEPTKETQHPMEDLNWEGSLEGEEFGQSNVEDFSDIFSGVTNLGDEISGLDIEGAQFNLDLEHFEGVSDE